MHKKQAVRNNTNCPVYFKEQETMKKEIEMCIRDKNNLIVGWITGYSDDALKALLETNKVEGWHISYAEDIEKGYR